jgi:hypothetical protein
VHRTIFEQQYEKLKLNYGTSYFNNVKKDLFFARISYFEEKYFPDIVDDIILNNRYMPQLDDFIKKYDEYVANDKLKQLQHPLIQITSTRPNSIFTLDEIKLFIKTIMNVLNGKAPKETLVHLENYVKHRLETAGIKYTCPKCEDKGFWYEEAESGAEYAYRCTCKLGEWQPVAWPRK